MTGHSVVPGDVESYLEVAARGRSRDGVRVALDVLERGSRYDDVIVDLLGAAQQESGERWLHCAWTVADEHTVSAVTQAALDAVASTVDQEASTGTVVVTCAEGDWHSLAGQMFAEQLRGRGVNTVFLGASTPAAQVEEFLSRHEAELLAISCNLPIFFRGVASLVEAAHRCGIPVLAGGRGLGSDPRRALLLGADAWARTIDQAMGVLTSWRLQAPVVPRSGASLDAYAVRLDEDAPELGERGFAALESSLPQLAAFDAAQRARTLEDLVYMVRFAAAARMVDDPDVLGEFLEWLLELLGCRGVPARAVVAGLRALEPGVSGVDAAAGQLLLGAARHVEGRAEGMVSR